MCAVFALGLWLMLSPVHVSKRQFGETVEADCGSLAQAALLDTPTTTGNIAYDAQFPPSDTAAGRCKQRATPIFIASVLMLAGGVGGAIAFGFMGVLATRRARR